jgi:hypothetical protein
MSPRPSPLITASPPAEAPCSNKLARSTQKEYGYFKDLSIHLSTQRAAEIDSSTVCVGVGRWSQATKERQPDFVHTSATKPLASTLHSAHSPG